MADGHLLLESPAHRVLGAEEIRSKPRKQRAAYLGIHFVIGPCAMDVGPTLTVATTRQLRRADRRRGLDALLRMVAADLLTAADRRNLSSILTQRLAEIARVRSIGLKEIASTMPARAL